MCGICGKVSSNTNSNINEGLIRKMCSVLTHRGPDDEGVYIANSKWQMANSKAHSARVGLGHRRLSIIDLSHAGHQPMSNEDGSIWIVMNGEIYNFLELREAMEKKGHIFKSHSDTEVLLHLYEDRGVDCLAELRGMFAFAIWDAKSERLFIARDRVGKKPLHYIFRNNTLIFASEMKALLKDPDVSIEVNRPAISDYLTYGYIPTPETIFKNIMKLPPAHFMLYEKGNIEMRKYWQLDFSKKTRLPEPEYCEKIMDLLEEATRIRLISDVPLGAFLSGGIDSSAVVYMMSRLMSDPVKTFSIGFKEETHSELKYARIIADRFKTDHHEYIVKPDAIELLPKLVWNYNEPYADSSALPSYYVAKMTKQEVKVALNGDGGDEGFGGYERFMAARFAEVIRRRLPHGFRKFVMRPIVNKIPVSLKYNNFFTKLKRFVLMAEKPYSERHYNWMSIFRDKEKESLFTDGFKKETGNRHSFFYLNNAFRECASKDIVDLVMSTDFRTYLLDDLLVKMDIATMSNSLEGRSPFLDHKLLEFAASIPSDVKIKGRRLKHILKKALVGKLPAEILGRGKMGFGIPVDSWFRSELKNYSYDTLMSQAFIKRGYFKKEAVGKLLEDHFRARANNGARIWALVNLELWHRIFIDG